MDTGTPDAPLKVEIQTALKTALKSGDKPAVETIRLLLAAIKNAEITKRGGLDDGDILGVITKQVRQREESIEAFTQGNRADLVAIEEAEMALLKQYLPAQISRDEIVTEAERIIAEVGAQGPGDKNKVMPKLMPLLKGKADGRIINEVVTELLGR